MLLEIVQTRRSAAWSNPRDPAAVAPFVSRDSCKYILNTLDAAATSLSGGGAAFCSRLHQVSPGSTLRRRSAVNRALKAGCS
jgi:hypothetical protein